MVVAVSTRHELWRDEVRAFSLALDGPNLFAMLPGLRGEGHPFLWYAVLRIVHMLVRSPLALPVASLAVALAAAIVFVLRAPFSPARKAVFLFGSLPAFEYAVMCRNYGLGMLLLFLLALTEPRRFERPLVWGSLLFLLASASAHAAMLAAIFALCWTALAMLGRPTPLAPERRGAFAGALALVAAGLAACAWLTFPAPDSAVTSIARADPGALAGAALATLLRPGEKLVELVTGGLPLVLVSLDSPAGHAIAEWIATAFVLLAAWRLRRHRELLAAWILAVLAFGLFFRVVYTGWLRHVGQLYVALLAIEWIARRREAGETRPWERTAFAAALFAVMALHAWQGVRALQRDWGHSLSNGGAFAAFVNARPEDRDAIVICEPDYLLETLPAYLPNRLWSIEEGGFRRWTHFSRSRHDTLALGTVIDQADSLARADHAPVLIALGQLQVLADTAGCVPYRYSSWFSWTSRERDRLAGETSTLGGFLHSDGSENVAVFRIPAGGIPAH